MERRQIITQWKLLSLEHDKRRLVPLTLCPLMGGNLSQKDRIKKALEFSRKAEEDIPKREVEKIESVVYAMAEKKVERKKDIKI